MKNSLPLKLNPWINSHKLGYSRYCPLSEMLNDDFVLLNVMSLVL